MLDDANSPLPRSASNLNRRDFLARSASLGAAAALPGTLLANDMPRVKPRADAVIQIFLGGGLSHIDTFDPKPDAPIDVRGPFRSIPTKVDDQRFSELCRNLAKIADKLTVVRSLTHTEAAHERGAHNMLTGYRPSPAIASAPSSVMSLAFATTCRLTCAFRRRARWTWAPATSVRPSAHSVLVANHRAAASPSRTSARVSS